MSHVRSRFVVAALGALALAGCAVPGQDAPAGAASVYEGTTVTNSQVDAAFSAWSDDTDGALSMSRDEVLTMELLHDDLMAACIERGTPIHTSDATRLAQAWFEGLGLTSTPSDEFVRTFESQFALTVLALDEGDDTLTKIINSAKDNAVVSPRSGEIDVDAFLASVEAARTTATQEELGQQSYLPFQHVSAFSDANASWIDRG
jgi:hypothetical protein